MPTIKRTELTKLASLARHGDFRRVVILCCLLFLALQALYISRLPLVMDEFQHAASTYRLAQATPYKDFSPYKTVLGYYIQLPALLMADRPWNALLAVKIEMAIVVAIALALSAFALRRHFNQHAVLLGLGMLIVMSTFAERAAELRVDTLTAVAGLASLLLLLARRHFLAGLVCGVSLLISQKGVFYVLSADVALGILWVLHHRSLGRLRPILVFNVAVGAILLAYLLFWAVTSSWNEVVRATFFSHTGIAFGQLYDNQLKYWSQTLSRNPLFYLLALLGLKSLLQGTSPGMDRGRQILLASYGATMIALSVMHRQPWPYFFVLLVPTLFVLLIAFFDAEIRGWPERSKWYRRVTATVLVGLGFALPLSRVPIVAARDSGYQRAMVSLADRLLREDESYLAGTDLIFDRPQEVRRLSWLDIPSARILAESPIYELEQLRRELEASSTKIVINNYRLYRLPRILRNHLEHYYLPLWGSIAIYAPTIAAGSHTVEIRFSGDYELLGPPGTLVTIDGRDHMVSDQVHLERGSHAVDSPAGCRLRYIPQDIDDYLDPEYRASALMFPDVYTY